MGGVGRWVENFLKKKINRGAQLLGAKSNADVL